MNIEWLNQLGHVTKRNSPAILSGAAIAGVIITAALAVRATPRAVESIADTKDKKIYDRADQEQIAVTTHDQANLSILEVIKATWVHYLPAGVAGAATIACIAGANKIGMQRNAALVAAYTLVDRQMREYKDHVVDAIGAGKEEKIREVVAQKQIESTPLPSKEIILASGSDTLCFETYTGRYFRSDIEKIRRAENEINFRIGNDMYASLNEFGDEIGLEHTDVGDEVGWNIEHRVKIAFTSHLHPDGIPCLAFSYLNNPRPDYGKCF
jgi:Family of unknown function (DUF6353)